MPLALITWLESGGVPTHPIAPGGPPLGTWGGVAPPYVDIGGPPPQPGIWPSPGHPAHPIAPGGPPLGIWGGANQPFPTPPIYIGPPSDKPPADKPIEWHTAWSPVTGWIVVGVPTVPVPTPSAKTS